MLCDRTAIAINVLTINSDHSKKNLGTGYSVDWIFYNSEKENTTVSVTASTTEARRGHSHKKIELLKKTDEQRKHQFSLDNQYRR